MKYKNENLKFLILATPIAYLSATILHFSYDFLGRFVLLAGLMPVSESIWEHLKLVFYPLCIVFLAPWNKLVKIIPFSTRIVMTAAAALIGKVLVAGGYYGLKSGLSLEGIGFDLLLLLLGLILGICHGLFFKTYTFPHWAVTVSCVYLITDIVLFYVFSFFIPDLPVFQAP